MFTTSESNVIPGEYARSFNHSSSSGRRGTYLDSPFGNGPPPMQHTRSFESFGSAENKLQATAAEGGAMAAVGGAMGTIAAAARKLGQTVGITQDDTPSKCSNVRRLLSQLYRDTLCILWACLLLHCTGPAQQLRSV